VAGRASRRNGSWYTSSWLRGGRGRAATLPTGKTQRWAERLLQLRSNLEKGHALGEAARGQGGGSGLVRVRSLHQLPQDELQQRLPGRAQAGPPRAVRLSDRARHHEVGDNMAPAGLRARRDAWHAGGGCCGTAGPGPGGAGVCAARLQRPQALGLVQQVLQNGDTAGEPPCVARVVHRRARLCDEVSESDLWGNGTLLY